MEYLFDTEIALDSLQKIKAMLEVYWKGVMGMRDKISHHYFEIDADVVFRTIEEDIRQMKPVVEKMINDINKN